MKAASRPGQTHGVPAGGAAFSYCVRVGRALTCILLVGTACRPAPPSPQGRFIVISLDTLRADHLGAYGYPRDTSPFFDSLAGRGVLFENAIAQVPGTLPSHMSIFTGLYPAEHAVAPPDGVLAPGIPTLPEVLRALGFRTAGHVEGGYMDGRHGFARGFEEWSDDSPILSTAEGPRKDRQAVKRTFRRGLEFLERVRAERSFFLFLHTYSVHDPYDPPEPYRSLYWKTPPPAGAMPPDGPTLAALNNARDRPAPEVVAYYRALYDAQIRYTDDVLRDFFAGLERLDLADEVTVIITSDHGEEFLEHGQLAHTQVYQECVHVPLLVLRPGQPRAVRVEELVQSIDIAPTLFELAGIPAPARPRTSGRSLVPLFAERPAPSRREAYAEAHLTADRALYRQTGEAHVKLVRREPRREGDTAWVSRSILVDAPAPRLRTWVASYRERRRLEVRIEGRLLATHPIDPAGRWIEMAVPPHPRGRRVEFRTADCSVPRDLGEGGDTRCLSFRLTGIDLTRLELYDVEADPEERMDLSRERLDLARDLAQRLGFYRWKPQAPAGIAGPDQAAQEQLRALGYVQ